VTQNQHLLGITLCLLRFDANTLPAIRFVNHPGVFMFKKIAVCAAVMSLGIGQSMAQAPAPAAPPPAWKQGMPAEMATSTLAPLAGKLTVTAAADIPLNKLKLPPGFKAEIWSTGTPGVRAMTRGESGKIYAGTRGLGRVYEISDNGKERTSRVLVDKLNQPAVTIHKGNLYVMSVDKALRYDNIEANPNAQPVDMTAAFKLPPLQPVCSFWRTLQHLRAWC
jgi:glucose/arabinose dehydrogenase